MRPGKHARIAEKRSGGRYFASVYVRDSDGRRRRVERSSAKSPEDRVKAQTCGQYRQVWEIHVADQLGALLVTKLPTSRANAHIHVVRVRTPSQAGRSWRPRRQSSTGCRRGPWRRPSSSRCGQRWSLTRPAKGTVAPSRVACYSVARRAPVGYPALISPHSGDGGPRWPRPGAGTAAA